jgi:pimeloyl-ACP methyl ester carboxylesterase
MRSSSEALTLLAEAKNIGVPALVLGGELDVTVPAEHTDKIADALPYARFVRLAGVGHFVEVETHDEWRDIVTVFLRG